MQWVVQIDELPYGRRLGVDIGLDLQSAATSGLPTHCPVLLHLENLPIADRFEVVMALDISSGMDADRRRAELERVARALADYMAQHINLGDVRAAYHSGDFASAFIHMDARALLEAEAVS